MLTASLAALFLTLCYAGACASHPFRRCRRCQGHGRTRTPTGRTSRPCRRCRGTGWRLRLGRRAYTWWTRTHAAGTRPDPQDPRDLSNR